MVIAGNFLTLNNVDKTFYIPQSISPKIMATYERKLAVLPVLCYAHNTAASWTAARLLRTIENHHWRLMRMLFKWRPNGNYSQAEAAQARISP